MTHYTTLSLPRTASLEIIRTRYLHLALSTHPDKQSHPHTKNKIKSFHEIQLAYTILSNPLTRARYDAKLERERHVHVHEQREWEEYRTERGYQCRCGSITYLRGDSEEYIHGEEREEEEEEEEETLQSAENKSDRMAARDREQEEEEEEWIIQCSGCSLNVEILKPQNVGRRIR